MKYYILKKKGIWGNTINTLLVFELGGNDNILIMSMMPS